MKQETRWEQRFTHLKQAFAQLKDAVNRPEYSNLEKQGLIKAFEFTYELAWKTLQDLLEERGYPQIKGPKPVIEQAFKDGYITEGNAWMKMLQSRNLTTHTYDLKTANAVIEDINQEYYLILEALINRLDSENF